MIDWNALFDWALVVDNSALLLSGARTTLLLSAVAVVLAAIIGTVLAAMRASPFRVLSCGSRLYIELIRGTPLLVQMYMLYFGFPSLGITLSSFMAAAIALANNSGSYVGEILRSALQSVERPQRESGRALGMGYWVTQWRIVVPQAFPIALPGLVGEVVDIVKWSALGSIVVVPEITQVVFQITGQTYRGFGILFLLLASFYFVVTASISAASRRSERRLTRHRLRTAHA